jgi:hypothetical protein
MAQKEKKESKLKEKKEHVAGKMKYWKRESPKRMGRKEEKKYEGLTGKKGKRYLAGTVHPTKVEFK